MIRDLRYEQLFCRCGKPADRYDQRTAIRGCCHEHFLAALDDYALRTEQLNRRTYCKIITPDGHFDYPWKEYPS